MKSNRHDEYMAKAEDAAKRAAKSKDTAARTAWEQIAEAYRDLARQPERWR